MMFSPTGYYAHYTIVVWNVKAGTVEKTVKLVLPVIPVDGLFARVITEEGHAVALCDFTKGANEKQPGSWLYQATYKVFPYATREGE